MKKIIALALSVMLLLGCVSALAETAERETITIPGVFSLKYDKLPEGLTFTVEAESDMEYQAKITYAEAGKPYYILAITFYDEWDNVNTLAEATEEDIIAVKKDFYDVLELDYGDIVFEDGKIGQDFPVLIAKDKNGSFGAIYGLFMSHDVEIDIYHEDDAPVTDEEIKAVLAFVDNVEFIPVEK